MNASVLLCGFLIIASLYYTEGCPSHGSRRRKRSITAPDVDEKLAQFFGTCPDLVGASTGIFDSLQSAVDYVIRDTNWYRNVSENLCTGAIDTPECWIYAVNFLIDSQSQLFKATADCICKWSDTCFDASSGQHHLVKRSEVYELPNFQIFLPPYPTEGYDPTEPSYPIEPIYTTPKQGLSNCLNTQSRKLSTQYPSLKRVDGESIKTFIEDQYTFCRYVPNFPYEQRNLFRLLYTQRLCPRLGEQASWRRNFSSVFTEATRKDGPIWASYVKCEGLCDDGSKPLNCGIIPQCSYLDCPAYPMAKCRESNCGSCRTWWEDKHGNTVNCQDDTYFMNLGQYLHGS